MRDAAAERPGLAVSEAGKRTPVRPLLDGGRRARVGRHVRDVRGFAVKFYTDQGVWDLVGTNIPCSSSRTR